MGRDKYWTPITIKRELAYLISKKETYGSIRKNHSGLLRAVEDQYGGLVECCEKIGLDFSNVISKSATTRYLLSKLTKEQVDYEIRKLYTSDSIVKTRELATSQRTSWIVSGANLYYGNWTKALESLEIKGNYSKNKNEILDLYKEGLSGQRIADKLKIGSTSVFKVLKENDIKARGTDIAFPVLGKNETVNFLRNTLIPMSRTERITPEFLRKNYSQEYRSIKKHFGSLGKAVTSFEDIYVLDTKIAKKWSKSFLIRQIVLANKLNKPLNISYMYANASSAITVAQDKFGSWENAIKAAGIDYNDILIDSNVSAYYGRVFEEVLDEIYTELGIAYDKYNHKKWRPDYVFKDNVWGDAKLSQWTLTQTTLENYEPNCSSLIIVFLRGDESVDKMISAKTRMMSVYKLVKQLPEDSRSNYIKKLSNIEKELASNELGSQSKDIKKA